MPRIKNTPDEPEVNEAPTPPPSVALELQVEAKADAQQRVVDLSIMPNTMQFFGDAPVDLVLVTLTQGYGSYNAGEVIGVTEAQADHLIARGLARKE